MSLLRLVVIALAGAACSGTLVAGAFAGKIQNFTGKKWDARPEVSVEQPGLFFQQRKRNPSLFFEQRNRQREDFFGFRKPVKAVELVRKRRIIFAGVDPEARKPKSPDAGFDIYQPVKLVALSAPDLMTSIAAAEPAATIMRELRASPSPFRVTAQQKDAIVNFYRVSYFRPPLWVDSQGLNDRAKR